MKVKLFVTVVLLLLVIVFMAQNSSTVPVRFLLWEIDLPRSLLIFMTLLIGMLIGWFVRAMFRLTRAE